MASNNNGDSYQTRQFNASTYQEIPNGGNTSANSNGGRRTKQWAAGILLALVTGAGALYYYYKGNTTAALPFTHGSSSGKTATAALSTASVQANGKLKLFDELNRYVLEDFDAKATFSSFLPGVAGFFGKPVWVFYVNRGQAVSTFGTESKDYPILEFNPANKAYQMTPFWGFRSFIRGTRQGGTSFQMEPFAPANTRHEQSDGDATKKEQLPKRVLFVGTNEVEIQETDSTHGVATSVKYFILPEENFASLIRRTTIVNTGDSELVIDVLDGLAKMEPFGGPLDGMLKSMGRTLEGWMGVYHADETLNMPFYKLSTEPGDKASVKIEQAGHYCLSFIENSGSKSVLLPIVFDSSKVFGMDTSLEHPAGLYKSSVEEILAQPQYGWAKTSSAFAAATNIKLKRGQNVTIASVYGKAESIERLPELASLVTASNFVETKFQRARSLINDLTAGVDTETVNPLFDGTVRQMFLDNSLRGGIPTILGNVDADTTYDEDAGVKVFHSFSRIHGDLERDYNAFKIDATFFSQGPGNYRDVAQNRRTDVTFFPRMGSFDVQMFLSYIQSDGYEPLTVEAVVFRFEKPEDALKISTKLTADTKSAEALGNVLGGGPFRPGQVFQLCEQLNIQRNLKYSDAEFINMIIEGTEDRAMAVFGTGYWADHWDYYMDLIEAYLEIFPDKEEQLMYDTPLRYFFSTATVKPRSQKYVLDLTVDGKSHHVLQLDSTVFDMEKAAEQQAFFDQNTGLMSIEANWQRTNAGEPFMSSGIAKLLHLGAIKYAMRDAWGMGVEYEGDKPGWLDSMNGLPGMVGSGMPETYELKLLLQYVRKVMNKYNRRVVIPSELHKMITTVNGALETLKSYGVREQATPSPSVPKRLFEYWDVVSAARESYRNDVQYYFSGNTTSLHAKDVAEMLDNWLEQIDLGIARSFKFSSKGYGDDGSSGIPACFFAYDVTDWEETGNRNAMGHPLVIAKSMSVKIFPLFLEGPVRYMKTIQNDPKKMVDMYDRVLTSGLRDDKLKMYYLSASLQGQSFDMGRQIAFAPGWLENQSIWMHMSYKYYLQLLRGKLYEQFFAEMKGGGILPFMDPDVYGRSLMECSSFIASSAFPDPSIAGKGYLARLSGSTAEFMDIWKLMFLGPNVYTVDKSGALQMKLTPALPSWLFEDKEIDNAPKFDEAGNHIVKFKLFASIPVTYHNPGGVNRFGESPQKYTVTKTNGESIDVDGPYIQAKTAAEIRRMKTIASIDAYF